MERSRDTAAFDLQDSRKRFRQKLAALHQVLQKRRADRSSLSASSTTATEHHAPSDPCRRSQTLSQHQCLPSQRGVQLQPAYRISRSPSAASLSPTLPISAAGSSSRSPEPCLWQESSPPRVTMNPRALVADDECELLDSCCRTQGRRSASVTTAALAKPSTASSPSLSRQIRGPFQGLSQHVHEEPTPQTQAQTGALRVSYPQEDERRNCAAASPQLAPRVADAAVQSLAPHHPVAATASSHRTASVDFGVGSSRCAYENHSQKPATRSASVQCIVDFPLPPPPPQATVSTAKAMRVHDGTASHAGVQPQQQLLRHRLFAPSSAAIDPQTDVQAGPWIQTQTSAEQPRKQSAADVVPSFSPQPRGHHTHVAVSAPGYRLQAHHSVGVPAAHALQQQRRVSRQQKRGSAAAPSSASTAAAQDLSRIASRNSEAELRHQQRMLKQRLSKQRPSPRVDAVLRSLVSRSSSAASSKARGPSAYESVLQEGLPREDDFTAPRTPSLRRAQSPRPVNQRRGGVPSRRTNSTASVTSSASEPTTRSSSAADRLADMYLLGRSTSAALRSVSPSHRTETDEGTTRMFATARHVGTGGTGTRIRSPAVTARMADLDSRRTGIHRSEDSTASASAAARNEPHRQRSPQPQEDSSGTWLSPPPYNARSSVEAPRQRGGVYMSPRSDEASSWPPALRAAHHRSPSALAGQRPHEEANQHSMNLRHGDEPAKQDHSPHALRTSSLRASVPSAQSPSTRTERRSRSPGSEGAVALSPEALKLHNALLGGRRSHSRQDGTEVVVHPSTASTDAAVHPAFATVTLQERPVNASAASSSSSAVGGKSRFTLRQLYQESSQRGESVATGMAPSTTSRLGNGHGWDPVIATPVPAAAASRSDWWAAASASFHPRSTAEVSSDLEAASLLGRIAEMKKLMMMTSS